GVVPDCHGVTQNGSGSSSVTSPALVLVETPNESVCGGTVVSTKMNGQVKKSSPKKPRSRNIFKALFCCLRAQDVPQAPPPSQDNLLPPEENGTIGKVPAASLLPEVTPEDQGKICVVIDLDETLVHSSFKPISNADFIVPVEIEGTTHQVYVLKRPHVDRFLQRMGEMFECVLFTASLAKCGPVDDSEELKGRSQCGPVDDSEELKGRSQCGPVDDSEELKGRSQCGPVDDSEELKGRSQCGPVDDSEELKGWSQCGPVDDSEELKGRSQCGPVDDSEELKGRSQCGPVDDSEELKGRSQCGPVDDSEELKGRSQCGPVDDGEELKGRSQCGPVDDSEELKGYEELKGRSQCGPVDDGEELKGRSQCGPVDDSEELKGRSQCGPVDDGEELKGRSQCGPVDVGEELKGRSQCGPVDVGEELKGRSQCGPVDDSEELKGWSQCGPVDDSEELKGRSQCGPYADPVTDLLDQSGVFRTRLFRESCVFHQGCYVKDLSRLGRQLDKTLILDNSPASYIFHPENAVPVLSWFDDLEDTELLNLLPVFEELSGAEDVCAKLKQLREP
ncbi:hypothetical protein NFI96_022007, partial [Prochilodus magdalenae]